MNNASGLRPVWLASALVAGSILLAGCEGGMSSGPGGPPPTSTSTPPQPSTPLPVTGGARGGYFSGHVAGYYAEALITEEGDARIYVQSNPDPGGHFEPFQFVGKLVLHDDGSAAGTGVVVGERCRTPADGRFCDGARYAEVYLDQLGNAKLRGSLLVYDGTSDGHESWAVWMDWPTDTYGLKKAEPGAEQGTYWEALADFAHDGDVLHSIDAEGRWFFQGAHTGCTGNGRLIPHADGQWNVYDVDLLIENCDEEFAYLNRSFSGIATRSIGGWEWGDWLVWFLSSTEGEQGPIGVTMWGARF